MEVGIVRRINIDNEMQASYLDYAMSVIVSRALPDVRDGLKPVHRRILYAMYDLGLTSDKPYKKSARIVGEVLGKYHPHGDAAVYEAMVRMAQDFSLRYPLVDGQGNFGSVDGDNAAAMRYTEARLADIANEMLADIDRDTVDWNDNFDGTLREPSVLPAALPNLLVNGSSGIAVGMATNIPPHNLGEVCDALGYVIDNFGRAEDITTEDLMRFIQGPDFPTGGVVFRYEREGNGDDAEQVDAIERAYGSGKGSLVVQAKAQIEEMSRSRNRIVVTELPYQTDKSRLIERIAELVREGRLEGLTDLRDESDRTGMRICIELTRTVDPRQVLADLYKLTPLQSTFGVSLLALVDGEPRLLSLKKMLIHYVEHRQQVIVRRARHDLAIARQRAHILEGLLRALDVLDQIIALIRGSRTADAARRELIKQLNFSEAQAQAILDMQLRRLAALERQKLQDEHKEMLRLIKELEALLASPKKVLALIRQNLLDLKARYGDPRRTQIADRAKAVLTARDHAAERDVWVALDADGRLCTAGRGDQNGDDPEGRPAPQAAGTSAPGAGKGESTSPLQLFAGPPVLLVAANTRQDLYLFTASGRAGRVQGHNWPEAPGAPAADLAGLSGNPGGPRERIVSMLALLPPQGDEGRPAGGHLVLGTAQGKVKRVALADLYPQAHSSPQVIALEPGDELAWATLGRGQGEVLLITAAGQAIRFAEEEVRPMGLPAGGVGGIKLREGDRVVTGIVIAGAAQHLAILASDGRGKRVPLAEFPIQGRYGAGVIAARMPERSGPAVVAAALLGRGAWLTCVTANGKTKTLAARAVPELDRPAPGKLLMAPARDDCLARVLVVNAEDLPGAGGAPRGNDDGTAGEGRNGKGRRRAGTDGRTEAAAGEGNLEPAARETGTAESARATPAPRGRGGRAASGTPAEDRAGRPAEPGMGAAMDTAPGPKATPSAAVPAERPGLDAGTAASGRAKGAGSPGPAGAKATRATRRKGQLSLELPPEPEPPG